MRYQLHSAVSLMQNEKLNLASIAELAGFNTQPAFTRFMNEYLKYDLVKRQKMTIQTEIHLGHVIQAAIEKGFAVLGHAFNDYYFIDVGSPANYTRALKESLVGK